jgi:hypothetical protein
MARAGKRHNERNFGKGDHLESGIEESRTSARRHAIPTLEIVILSGAKSLSVAMLPSPLVSVSAITQWRCNTSLKASAK